jgi:predicted DNA-binding transcriptional regulator AlpA
LRNVKAVEVAEKLGMKEAIRYELVDEKQGMLY